MFSDLSHACFGRCRLEKKDKVREETQKTQKQIDQSLPCAVYGPPCQACCNAFTTAFDVRFQHLSELVTFVCDVFSGWHYTPAGGYFTYERALSLQQGEPTFLAKESMKFLPSPNVQATIHEQLK